MSEHRVEMLESAHARPFTAEYAAVYSIVFKRHDYADHRRVIEQSEKHESRQNKQIQNFVFLYLAERFTSEKLFERAREYSR